MNFIEFQKFCQDNEFIIFSIKDLKILLNEYPEEYLRLKINRWKKKGYINSLKKGLYTLRDTRFDEFEIAAHLITPSYISLESALSHYSIIPDVSGNITCVTTKNTRSFVINRLQYKYYHIKIGLFGNYHHLDKGIFIASPEKAVLDFFYFRKPSKDHQFFERLNSEIIKDFDLKKMNQLSLEYPLYVQKLTHYIHHVITFRSH